MELFVRATTSGLDLGPTQPPIQQVEGTKWPGREADHSSSSSAELTNGWNYTSTSPISFMAWCIIK